DTRHKTQDSSGEAEASLTCTARLLTQKEIWIRKKGKIVVVDRDLGYNGAKDGNEAQGWVVKILLTP
ncbi:MAG: hypothetical protein JSV99_01895, partial [Planctomycetota bacterium]